MHLNKLAIRALILFLAGSIILISCKKEEQGPPVITQVRLPDPDKADSTFTQADPGTLIVIQGENLGGLLHVYFNNYEASFNSVFSTDNNIIVRIPDEAPTEVIDPDVPHEIRIVTNHGEATYTFSLTPPPPEIYYISNENAMPGDEIFILGADFYLVEKIIFPGDIETTDFTVNRSAKTITVTVPQGATEAGKIKIVTTYHTVEAPMSFNDLSGEGVLCNFDDINSYIWGCQISSDDIAFPGARGNFAQLVNTNIGPGNYTWWEGNRVCFLDSIQTIAPENLGDVFSQYALKFEMYVKEIWNTGNITIVTKDWEYRYIFAPWLIDGVRADLVTDGWITYVISLTEFRNNEGTGDPAKAFKDIFWENGTARIGMAYMNTTPDPNNDEADAITLDNLSIGIDNIRVVKISGE